VAQGPGYTGHVVDAASGLIYMQQRYYDPVIGRFLSMDPDLVGELGLNFNRYAYVGNNPYRYVDPDGRDGACAFGPTGCGMHASSPADNARIEELTTDLAVVVVAAVAVYAAVEVVAVCAASPACAVGAGVGAGASSKGPTKGASGGQRAGKPFTPAGKREVINSNKAANQGDTGRFQT
jgi:RHS repeat-associated protein